MDGVSLSDLFGVATLDELRQLRELRGVLERLRERVTEGTTVPPG